MQSIENIDKFTTTDFSVLDISSSYANLINSYEKIHSPIIFMLDKKKRFIGYISLEKILQTGFHTVTDKKITMKVPFIREFNLDNIIKFYLDNNLPFIPVVDQKDTIEYVLSLFEIAKEYLYDLEFQYEDVVEEIPLKVTKDEKIDVLMSKIKKDYVKNIPVIENGKFYGFIDAQKLISFLFKPEKSSRSGKSGVKQSFEGTVENLITEAHDIVMKKLDVYQANQLLELMVTSLTEDVFICDNENNAVGMIRLRNLINRTFLSLKEELENINITVLSAPDRDIDKIAKKKMTILIEKHSIFYKEKHEPESTVRFHKIENQSQKGRFRYETDIRISFGKGKDSVFAVKADDWGAEKSFNKAYNKISRMITDKGKIDRQNYQKNQ